MSETTDAAGADKFAELLRTLKDRSGLSYGALARRLHMSTSTLHRYCNGAAVPNEYAPVERLARVCRATPEELVELHRRWVMADAARRGRPGQAAPAWAQNDAGDAGDAADACDTHDPAGGTAAPEAAGAGTPADSTGSTGSTSPPDSAGWLNTASIPSSPQGAGEDGVPVVVDVPGRPVRSRRRRRHAVIASAVAVTVLGAVVLAVNLPSGDDGGGQKTAEPDTSGNATGTSADRDEDKRPSKSASPSASKSEKSGERSEPASKPAAGDGEGATEDAGGVPLTVATRPYSYETPCSQFFLVDKGPEQVGPPAAEPDATRWAAAYGAVSSGEQRVALTVQGTGDDPVTLKALRVGVTAKNAPLAWKDYEMGSGCGGRVGTRSFDVDLDAGSPTTTVKNGQRDFPYEISESEPLVLYVKAYTRAHDVRWDLSLDWSSGDRSGTVHIDDSGTPFRTSSSTGSPGYRYFDSEWVEREDRQGHG